MCPNQEVERSLLPDCHIANRVFMYSMLDYLHSGERRTEDVHAELRDRYEVFCQVLHNFPMPLLPEPEGYTDYECVFDALQQQQQHHLHQQQQQLWQHRVFGGNGNVIVDINESSSSSNLNESCDFYAMRSAIAQLRGGRELDMDMEMEMELEMDMELELELDLDIDLDMENGEGQMLNSSDDAN